MGRFKYDVYLAGTMVGRLGREVTAERANARRLCARLGLVPYDPGQDEVFAPNRKITVGSNAKLMRWFVSKDFRNLDRCRALVDLSGDRSSSGKGWEMARMKFVWRRPVVLVAPRMHDRSLVNFSTILADKVCATQLSALRYIKRRLGCRIATRG